MKKENDEITDLFRARLADTGMNVRDGFWEELLQDIPVACQHRRRLLLFRVAAAASVLLVLAASSATFLYFSPKEEMEEAFTKIAATNGGQMDGDGIRVNQLPLPVEPVLQKPAPQSFGMLSQYTEDEDSLAFTFSMSFSFSSAGSEWKYGNFCRPGGRTGGFACDFGENNEETLLGCESSSRYGASGRGRYLQDTCFRRSNSRTKVERLSGDRNRTALFKSSFGRTAFTLSGYTRAGKRDTGRYEESRPLCYRRRSGG